MSEKSTFDARRELVEDITEVIEETMVAIDPADRVKIAEAIGRDLAEQLPAFDAYVRAAYLEQRAHGGLSVDDLQSGRVAEVVREVEADFVRAVEVLKV